MQPFQEWVVQLAKIFSDFSVGGAAVVAAVLGVKGFTAWRKELVGKARYDAVRSVMKKAFEYQRAFNEARVDPDLPGGQGTQRGLALREGVVEGDHLEGSAAGVAAARARWRSRSRRYSPQALKRKNRNRTPKITG